MAGRKSLLTSTHKKRAKSGAVEAQEESKRKKAILDAVARSSTSVKATLQELGLNQSTYYRWLKRYKAEGLDGLAAGSPISNALWQRLTDFKKKEERLSDEGKLATEETQSMKGEQDKEEIRKALHEKPSKEPEKVAPSETESPPPAAQPRIVKEEPPSPPSYTPPSQEPADSTLKYAIYGIGALAFVIALLLLASRYNSNKFYFKQDARKVELLQGRFAPKGERLVESFRDPKILEAAPKQKVYTKKEAFGIVLDYLLKRADGVLKEREPLDLRSAKSHLTRASNYVVSGADQEAVRLRLNSIEFVLLMDKTNLALSRTPLPDFRAAWGYLAQGVPVASTDLQIETLMERLTAVEYALESRNISKGEGEIADLSKEAAKLRLRQAREYGAEKSLEIKQEDIAKMQKWLNAFDKKYVEPIR